MGTTNQKQSKFFCFESKIHQFEVYMPKYSDNASLVYQNHSWCILEFIHKNSSLQVIKDEQVIEVINLDKTFEVINEQPDELIFTIKFSTNTDNLCRWKIRCKSNEEYTDWTVFLKKSLRHKWKNNKNCAICKKNFGLFHRKHHCRKCGKCICDTCSPIRSTLPELAYTEMVRICCECGRDIEEKRKGSMSLNTPNFTSKK